MASRETRHGVLILGGGPAGLATALSLSRAGASAVVVERSSYDEPRIGEHLPPNGIASLVDGGFSVLRDDTYVPCTGINAWWGGIEPSYTDYLFHPVGHGASLSRPAFDAALAEQCRKAGVQLLTTARLIGATPTSNGWHVLVRCQDQVIGCRPRLIVDATGRAASFARQQGASIHATDSQVALIAFRSSSVPLDQTGARIVIESAEHGWWYFAPLRGGRCVCMFMTDADLLGAGPGSIPATWKERLQRTACVRACLDAYPVASRLVVRAARSQRLDRICGPRWLAVGDSAIAFDPLSSHGIAKGLEHGREAAAAILAHLDGDERGLQRLADRFATEFADYEQTRRGYYAIERRWPMAPFWRRRQAA